MHRLQVIKVNNNGGSSLIYLVGAILVAASVIIVAIIGISFGLYHFTGTGASEETLHNYASAQRELVVFTGYYPDFSGQGNWDGYYLSSDGRRFYTNSKITSQNFELFGGYTIYSYQIVLNGLPDNAWGIKSVVGMDFPPVDSSNLT